MTKRAKGKQRRDRRPNPNTIPASELVRIVGGWGGGWYAIDRDSDPDDEVGHGTGSN